MRLLPPTVQGMTLPPTSSTPTLNNPTSPAQLQHLIVVGDLNQSICCEASSRIATEYVPSTTVNFSTHISLPSLDPISTEFAKKPRAEFQKQAISTLKRGLKRPSTAAEFSEHYGWGFEVSSSKASLLTTPFRRSPTKRVRGFVRDKDKAEHSLTALHQHPFLVQVPRNERGKMGHATKKTANGTQELPPISLSHHVGKNPGVPHHPPRSTPWTPTHHPQTTHAILFQAGKVSCNCSSFSSLSWNHSLIEDDTLSWFGTSPEPLTGVAPRSLGQGLKAWECSAP
ncbi:hypothetical protein GWK47_000468 [Chionoecetes opilio]|uniref:Uncharacterized protein n=1 Tax=Chionoecetes opilio TaxID=41210 RepID=A0A8J4YAR5_CHIOP|nr:hypothetical protein GWK47_000468 [Chionoecetes opilio]